MFVQSIKADLVQVRGGVGLKDFLSAVLLNQSFKRILLYRVCHYCNNKILSSVLGIIDRLVSTHYNVYIVKDAEIGKGFCIGHCFSIIISQCKIGNNVVVMQQVTIGSSRGGKRAGVPVIGDNVFIGCGAKILGNVHIGNHVMIGANAVVTHDVPDGAVVGGVPAKILSMDGVEQSKLWCLPYNTHC